MRQKVKFAAAIVHDPKLLILDEPTSGLDPEERLALLSRLRVLSEEHDKAVLLSTHILPDVQNVCQNVVIIADGKLKVSDTLTNLNRTSSPAMHVKLFGRVDEARQLFQQRGFDVKHELGNQLIVSNDSADLGKLIWKLCADNDIPVQSLVPGKTSLEQVFISAVKEAINADS